MPSPAQAVTVSLEDLKNGTVALEKLQEAFGPDSLGILVVKDVPETFPEMRRRLLSYASYLGNLPAAELAKLENEPAKYLTGWSCGKETLKNGQVDTLKGSYYTNCAFYVEPGLDCARPTAEFSADTFPEYLSPNVWPAVLPGFQATLEELVRLIIDVAVLVARACDRFAEQAIAGYPAGYLEAVVSTSTTTKARLLHYFPQDESSGDSETAGAPDAGDDDWCATHLDHGCLTGLTSAMFVDEAAVDARPPAGATSQDLPPLAELDASPDPAAGLYISSRAGEVVQVKIPRDCIAFQTGEALERITAGQFKAVPHFVRGARAGNGASRIARNTLAVFTQPNLGDEVDREQHITFGEFARGIVAKNTVGSYMCIQLYNYIMALAPKFAAHRLVFADISAAAASAEPLHTIEVFLDYVCPFSAKLFNTLYTGVAPQLRASGKVAAAGRRVQVVFRHQVQPWHPSSTLVHEAGLAVQRAAAAAGTPQLFWDFSAALFKDQKAYMDVNVVDEGRNATYRRLAQLAETVSGGAIKADDVYAQLAIPTQVGADGSVNVGNAITNDLKLVIKAARLVGVHVSPTVLFDGLVNNDVSSSWTVEQWLEWLEKSAV